jgi:hypothetical protein
MYAAGGKIDVFRSFFLILRTQTKLYFEEVAITTARSVMFSEAEVRIHVALQPERHLCSIGLVRLRLIRECLEDHSFLLCIQVRKYLPS